jgi:molybdenum cofactor synthesis domain-containing protein
MPPTLSLNDANKTAAVLVIGDEILSGRTQDSNSHYIAKFLAVLGIDLQEIRVVPDIEAQIVAGLNALRDRNDMVFTTGGIGPTHDDITADAVAKAFDVGIGYHPEAYALLEARYAPGEFNDMRKRMARIPHGASLIKNSASVAPGFHIGNVYVMAGVPAVMRAMLEAIAPTLPRGVEMTVATVSAALPEGAIATGLAAIQKMHGDVTIGSYPFYSDSPGGSGGPGTQLVTRGRDAKSVEQAAREIEAMVTAHGITPLRL